MHYHTISAVSLVLDGCGQVNVGTAEPRSISDKRLLAPILDRVLFLTSKDYIFVWLMGWNIFSIKLPALASPCLRQP